MHRISFIVSIGVLIGSLNGCLIQEDSDLKTPSSSNQVSSVSDAGVVLSDDGIAAPAAPTLSISATAGALNFKWFDWRTNAKITTSTKLFEYNTSTEQEIELDANIEPGDLRFTLPITPHRLAWNANSYRVEICTSDNCISSLRVPIRTLLSHSFTAVTPTSAELSPSFGADLAINDTGIVAVASSPSSASAAVFLHIEQKWVQLSTLTSEYFSMTTDADMSVSLSANGDTIAIASMSSTNSPMIVIFDRLGENWIETAVITPFEPIAFSQLWDTASLSLQLSDNGDRLAFAAQPLHRSANKLDVEHNQVLVFDRSALTWTRSASLTIPLQHTRLYSTTTSGSIDKIVALSALDTSLYIHEFSLSTGQWLAGSSQLLNAINPSSDTKIVSSHDAAQISLAAWEFDNDSRRSAVAWKLEKRTTGWIALDSIRMPPTNDQSARLRLASDAHLQSLAVGWQAQADANLAFYTVEEQRWQHQFSLPEGLDLDRSVALVQSIALSADNTTVLIGTTNTGSGGVVNSLR